MPNILLAKNSFYYSNYKKSSHIQFYLDDNSSIPSSDKAVFNITDNKFKNWSIHANSQEVYVSKNSKYNFLSDEFSIITTIDDNIIELHYDSEKNYYACDDYILKPIYIIDGTGKQVFNRWSFFDKNNNQIYSSQNWDNQYYLPYTFYKIESSSNTIIININININNVEYNFQYNDGKGFYYDSGHDSELKSIYEEVSSIVSSQLSEENGYYACDFNYGDKSVLVYGYIKENVDDIDLNGKYLYIRESSSSSSLIPTNCYYNENNGCKLLYDDVNFNWYIQKPNDEIVYKSQSYSDEDSPAHILKSVNGLSYIYVVFNKTDYHKMVVNMTVGSLTSVEINFHDNHYEIDSNKQSNISGFTYQDNNLKLNSCTTGIDYNIFLYKYKNDLKEVTELDNQGDIQFSYGDSRLSANIPIGNHKFINGAVKKYFVEFDGVGNFNLFQAIPKFCLRKNLTKEYLFGDTSSFTISKTYEVAKISKIQYCENTQGYYWKVYYNNTQSTLYIYDKFCSSSISYKITSKDNHIYYCAESLSEQQYCGYSNSDFINGKFLKTVSSSGYYDNINFGLFNFRINSCLYDYYKNTPSYFLIQDYEYVFPYNDYALNVNVKSIQSSLIKFNGKELQKYLSLSENTNNPYINDDYKSLIVAYDKNIVCNCGTYKNEIIYFENKLTLSPVSFNNKNIFYVYSSSGKKTNFEFNLKYMWEEKDQETQEIVDRQITIERKIPIKLLKVSQQQVGYTNYLNQSQSSSSSSSSSSQTLIVREINSPIYYDEQNNKYTCAIDWGISKPVLQRQSLTFKATNVSSDYDGKYELMTFSEVSPYYPTLIEQDYDGYNKIYKHQSKELYFRVYRKEVYVSEEKPSVLYKFWAIFSSIGGEDSSSSSSSGQSNPLIISNGGQPSGGQPDNENKYANDPGAIFTDYGGMGVDPCTVVKEQGQSQDGRNKSIIVSILDDYNSFSNELNSVISIYKTSPNNLSLKIIGSSGNTHYTGFYEKYNRFFPSQFVTIQFSARSQIGLKYRIYGNSLMSQDDENTWHDMIASTTISKVVKLKPSSGSTVLGLDSNIEIFLQVKDSAQNYSNTTSSIKYFSRLFRSENINLLTETSAYSHSVYQQIGTNAQKISKNTTSVNQFVRSWNEIWYPQSHGSPLNEKGQIDSVAALQVANNPSLYKKDYDSLMGKDYDQSTGKYAELAVDSDGRYYQNINEWSDDKTYQGMVNSKNINNVYSKYWIIDNSGNVDFKLQFEIFDFSKKITQIPANLSAPYSGDMVAIYDASAEGATYQYVDSYGNTKYYLSDSTKLTLLFVLKGSYKNDIDKQGGKFTIITDGIGQSLVSVGNGFITPNISQCSRVCIVPFTDYGDSGDSVATGFKLKAGPKHFVEYTNYENNNKTGQFWIHIAPQYKNGVWKTCDNILLNYKYYDSYVNTNYDQSQVYFEKRMNYPILATFNNYLYLYKDNGISKGKTQRPYGYFSPYNDAEDLQHKYCINSFITSQDDMVDYSSPYFNVSMSSKVTENGIYDFSNDSQGRLTSNYTLVKDTGVLKFNLLYSTPKGRIFGDYYYHTFYRLTSDGYGDLYFYGTGTLVPASTTELYTDWTYVDLKIINEGDNALSSGTLKFLARGYVSAGTVVDVVLDQNRPWDVQQGTTAETVLCAGGNCATSYASLVPATRANACSAKSSQNVSLGYLNSKNSIYVRVFWCIAANSEGTDWVDVTRGSKTFSAQLAGKYYIFSN